MIAMFGEISGYSCTYVGFKWNYLDGIAILVKYLDLTVVVCCAQMPFIHSTI